MDLFPAKLDGFEIKIFDINDSISQSVTKHDFIFTDGAFLINTGLKAREIKFKAYFFGENYNIHFDFLSSITDTTILHTLIHPKYGQVEGYVETSDPVHDDTQNYVEIDITFIQHGIIQSGQLINLQAIQQAIEAQQIAAINNDLLTTANIFQNSGIGDLLGKTVAFTQKLNGQINGISQKARNFLKEIDDAVEVFDSFLSTISEPANIITNACNFISDVPSRLSTSINSCCYRIINSLSAMQNLPLQFINSTILGVENVSRTLSGDHASFFQTRLATAAAGHVAAQAAILMQLDDSKARIQLNNETTKTFDSYGNRINNKLIEPAMSSNELDSIAYQVRNQIQQIISVNTKGQEYGEDGRDNVQLINMASYIQDYVNTIKLNRNAIKVITVNNIPLHLLCMQIGLPYNAMERILKLNPWIKNPTFTEGDLSVYAK